MANMSSFYGGRSAPSFTIVKNFDGIDVPSNKYTKTFYAVNDKNELVHGTLSFWEEQNTDPESIVRIGTGENPICIIRKTRKNFAKYSWRLTENNGAKVDEIQLPQIFANGMLQCFNKGVATLDEVNYQEYVLIDTVTNLNEYSNPDNGKIYRRGFDINNGIYGAEYIGRITGPQGYNTGIQLDTFSNINNDTLNQTVKGTVTADLLPGSSLEIENNQLKEGQGIECIYTNIIDEGGNVLQTKIGFKFPYLVNTFKSDLVAPYGLPPNLISETDKDGNMLSEEHSNNNPFYRHWSIKIPHGKKGKSIEEIRVQPTIIPDKTPYYDNLETLIGDIRDNNNYEHNSGLIEGKTSIPSDAYDKSNYCIVLKEGTETEPIYKYIDAKLCTNKKVFYTTRDYDSLEKGSVSIPFEVGDINSIIKTNLADDGTLTIYYDNGEEEIARNNIKWITSTKLNNNTSKLEINYNEGSKDIISPAINYIKEIYISTVQDFLNSNNNIPSKNLYIKFSDPDIQKLGVTIPNKGSGWTDFGTILPPAEGLRIAGNFKSADELTGPPEKLLGSDTYKGYAVTINNNILYYYDYRERVWINAGIITQDNITTKIITIGNIQPENSNMSVNGIWMVTSSIEAR